MSSGQNAAKGSVERLYHGDFIVGIWEDSSSRYTKSFRGSYRSKIEAQLIRATMLLSSLVSSASIVSKSGDPGPTRQTCFVCFGF